MEQIRDNIIPYIISTAKKIGVNYSLEVIVDYYKEFDIYLVYVRILNPDERIIEVLSSDEYDDNKLPPSLRILKIQIERHFKKKYDNLVFFEGYIL